jgi:guanylate kinase
LSGRRGIVFVLSGPSGVGKSTLVRRILRRDPGIEFSVSHTTRPARAGEVDGRDYHFVDAPRFQRMVDEERFLEWAEYQGHFYGTSRHAVEEPTGRGVDLLIEVEVQGARQLRERLPGSVSIFVLPPPSRGELEARLRARGSDDPQAMRKRLERAGQELPEALHYRYAIVNDEVDRAVEALGHIIEATRRESSRVLPGWRERFEAS